jgi:hypothetical protein
VALGVAMLVAMWIGGNPGLGLQSLGIMSAFGALILLGGRSETIRGLRGDGRDERFRQIDIHATALAGIVVLTAIIVASWSRSLAAKTAGHTRGSAPSEDSPT